MSNLVVSSLVNFRVSLRRLGEAVMLVAAWCRAVYGLAKEDGEQY